MHLSSSILVSMTAPNYRTLMFSYKSTCAFKLTFSYTKGNIQLICCLFVHKLSSLGVLLHLMKLHFLFLVGRKVKFCLIIGVLQYMLDRDFMFLCLHLCSNSVLFLNIVLILINWCKLEGQLLEFIIILYRTTTIRSL